MVNIKFLDKINLATSPWAQKFVANAILAPNYHLFAKVKIKMEHIENIPAIYRKQLLCDDGKSGPD